MSENILSVFIDESGDFGPYEIHAPYYLVSMIYLHANRLYHVLPLVSTKTYGKGVEIL